MPSARRMLDYIKRHGLLRPGQRVAVAVSGGIDSVALLRLLVASRRDLGIILSVAHFNHKLRGTASDGDQTFVEALARRHELEFRCGSGDVHAFSVAHRLSLEAAARKLRYEFFTDLLRSGSCERIATAHTRDDQAETVLMRFARGAGSRGLAGIYAEWSAPGSHGSVIRPLLAVSHRELQSYLAEIGQDWREDASNRDLKHTRNRVRHQIIPGLEAALNPQLRETLAETAEIARAEERYWSGEVERLLPRIWDEQKGLLSLGARFPLALERRMIRAASESLGFTLEFRHVEEVLDVSSGRAKSAELPGGWHVFGRENQLHFERAEPTFADYEYRFPIPGKVEVPEAGTSLEAILVPTAGPGGYNSEHFVDPALLEGELRVRNWRPGDRFWPAHVKRSKKIKELLQGRQVTGALKKSWPVVVSGAQVIWVRGFPVPVELRPGDGCQKALVIREIRMEEVSAYE